LLQPEKDMPLTSAEGVWNNPTKLLSKVIDIHLFLLIHYGVPEKVTNLIKKTYEKM
jgi:hypothetical protein